MHQQSDEHLRLVCISGHKGPCTNGVQKRVEINGDLLGQIVQGRLREPVLLVTNSVRRAGSEGRESCLRDF